MMDVQALLWVDRIGFPTPIAEGQNLLTCMQGKATLMWAGVKIQSTVWRELMEMGPSEAGRERAGRWVPGNPSWTAAHPAVA